MSPEKPAAAPVEPCQCSCHPNGIERSEGCDCGCCDHAHVIIDRGDDEVDRLLREQGYYPGGKPVEPLCQCGHTKRSHNDKGCWHGKAECGCDAYKPVEPALAVMPSPREMATTHCPYCTRERTAGCIHFPLAEPASTPAAEPSFSIGSVVNNAVDRVRELEAEVASLLAEVRQLVETELRVCAERDAALAEVASLRAALARVSAAEGE